MTDFVTVMFKRLTPWGRAPARMSDDAAAFDLYYGGDSLDFTLEPGKRTLVPTGIAVQLPSGWEGQVRSRSGLAARHGIVVLNSPGTIDADYRGEVKVVLYNSGDRPYRFQVGNRIAQLVVSRVPLVKFQEVAELDPTPRGEGGCGSTGA